MKFTESYIRQVIKETIDDMTGMYGENPLDPPEPEESEKIEIEKDKMAIVLAQLDKAKSGLASSIPATEPGGLENLELIEDAYRNLLFLMGLGPDRREEATGETQPMQESQVSEKLQNLLEARDSCPEADEYFEAMKMAEDQRDDAALNQATKQWMEALHKCAEESGISHTAMKIAIDTSRSYQASEMDRPPTGEELAAATRGVSKTDRRQISLSPSDTRFKTMPEHKRKKK